MGKKQKPTSKKKTSKARMAHKAVKKTAQRPTKSKPKPTAFNKPKAPPTPVAKTKSKSPAPAKVGKSAPVAPAPKSTGQPAKAPAARAAKPAAAPAPADAAEGTARLSPDELRKQLVAKARARTKPQRAVAFTLDDVRGELARSNPTRKDGEKSSGAAKSDGPPKAHDTGSKKIAEPKQVRRHLGAASLADILGYNPTANEKPEDEEAQIDKKFLRYYRLLIQLRTHVTSGLEMHAEDTLKRSNREDSGDLSGYGQHMADAGTDAFDRDFALSLVSNEQEALFEIEEAIKRIKNGSYGNCELTGKPIHKDRLLAVPFARYSVESQAEMEKNRRRSAQRAGLFGDAAGEEGARVVEDDSD